MHVNKKAALQVIVQATSHDSDLSMQLTNEHMPFAFNKITHSVHDEDPESLQCCEAAFL
jgi:hypothetical protein